MNYIINPSLFYWINVVDGLRTAFTAASIVFSGAEIIMMVLAVCCYHAGKDYGEDDSDYKTAKALVKPIIITGIITVVSIIAAIFIPSREALIEMQVAKFATYENAEFVVDAVKSAIEYIINAIQSLK